LLQPNDAFLDECRGEPDRLVYVLAFKLGPLQEHLFDAHAAAQKCEHSGHGNPHSPDTRLPKALLGVHRDAIKLMMSNLHGITSGGVPVRVSESTVRKKWPSSRIAKLAEDSQAHLPRKPSGT